MHDGVFQPVFLDVGFERLEKRRNGFFLRASLRHIHGKPIAHRENGHDLDDISQKGFRRADAASFLEKRQIRGREQKARTPHRISRRLGAFVKRFASLDGIVGSPHAKRLVPPGGIGIDERRPEPDVAGVNGARRAQCAVEGAGKLRRDEHAEHLVPRNGGAFEVLLEFVLRRLRRRGDVVGLGGEVGVERIQIHGRVGVFDAAVVDVKGYDVYSCILGVLCGNGCDRIGKKLYHGTPVLRRAETNGAH